MYPTKGKLLLFLILLLTIFSLYISKTKQENNSLNDCVNYEDRQRFDTPIPVEWTAKFDGCLAGCWGGAFTRVPDDPKYHRFSAYVPDAGSKIEDKYLKEGLMLKIYGKWTDITDSYGSIFSNKCVPTVEIEKIEISE